MTNPSFIGGVAVVHFSDSLIYHVLVVTDSVIISVIIKTTHLLSHNSHSMEYGRTDMYYTTICTILFLDLSIDGGKGGSGI